MNIGGLNKYACLKRLFVLQCHYIELQERRFRMANSLVQIRVDDKLKDEVTAIYDQLGLDLSTAVRIFFKRSVAEKGIPFAMKIDYDTKKDIIRKRIPLDILNAMNTMAENAEENGVANLNLEEINAEISAARKGM